MRYLPTAFGQLAFAWKLYSYGLEGKISAEELDCEVTFKEGSMLFVVPKALETEDDLILALQNNLGIAFGAAAITLNRVREECGMVLPNPIISEEDQCIALIYQIRNAFAHDIAEPKWKIAERYKRVYKFGGMEFDLTERDGEVFDYEHINGPDALYHIKDYFSENFGYI